MLPIKDFVVIRQLKASEKTKGIYLPDANKQKPHFGVVKFVGDACHTIKAGHVVALGGTWFTTYKLGDDEFAVLREEDIPGILEKDEIEALGKLLGVEELVG